MSACRASDSFRNSSLNDGAWACHFLFPDELAPLETQIPRSDTIPDLPLPETCCADAN